MTLKIQNLHVVEKPVPIYPLHILFATNHMQAPMYIPQTLFAALQKPTNRM